MKKTPSLSTISRARKRINLSEVFYYLVKKTKELGLTRGFILSIDSTHFKAYLKGDKEVSVGYCAAKEEFIFGYKAHIVTDVESELPIAVVVSPANEHDSKIRSFLRRIGVLDIIDRNKRRGKNFGKPKDKDFAKRGDQDVLNLQHPNF